MPWMTRSIPSQRNEFLLLAAQTGLCFGDLCTRFGISRVTGYKWKRRWAAGGAEALADRGRRPRSSPGQTAATIAGEVIKLRTANPTWCGRKLRRRLLDLKVKAVPAASTCTAILRRAGMLSAKPGGPTRPWQRFERAQPNELWQMDFKGHFPTQSGSRCHPLTVLDDHSRFNLVLEAKSNEQGPGVRETLTAAFARYGLPESILCDNGAPWGQVDPTCPYTTLTVWLLQLGISVQHGRPYHPQTQGKDERFHRSLHFELISRHTWRDLHHCAEAFPHYRQRYNCERPHDSLGGDTPITHYQPSVRLLPTALPPLEYPTGFSTLSVSTGGILRFDRKAWYIGRAFSGLRIGLRPSTQADPQWEVFFGHHRLGLINLAAPRSSHLEACSIYTSA